MFLKQTRGQEDRQDEVGWRGRQRMAGLRGGVKRGINSLLLGIYAKLSTATRTFAVDVEKTSERSEHLKKKKKKEKKPNSVKLNSV